MENEKWTRTTDGKWVHDGNVENAELLNDNNVIELQGHPNTEVILQENDTTSREDISTAQENSSFHAIFPNSDGKDQDLYKRITAIESENIKLKRQLKRLQSRIEVTEENIDDHHDYIYFLEKNLARLDQYGRRENVEISGIPSSVTDKQLESEVLRILRQIGLKHLDHFHVVACHRIGSIDKNGCRNTIVRFIYQKDAI